MTSVLIEKTCTPCRGGVPPLTVEEAEAYRVQAPEWVLRDEATRIERTYRFRSFGDAFAFVRGAGELAEAEFHHPDISFGWGYATVSLRTKKIKGLHENDFIMAVKLDQLAGKVAVAETARVIEPVSRIDRRCELSGAKSPVSPASRCWRSEGFWMPCRFAAWLVAAVLNRPTGGFVVSCRANTPMRLCRHCRHLPGIGMSAWTPGQERHDYCRPRSPRRIAWS